MIKKIDILGISVDNYTVRESLMQLDIYMNSTVLNVIETVTMKQLLSARENARVKECIEQANLCIIGEGAILSETGNATVQRMREIRDRDFMHELVKRAVRNQKQVFLMAKTREEVERMQKFFTEMSPKLMVAGSYAIEECAGDGDTIVNEINGATPDIIISALDSPEEEEFILTHRDKIGVGVWYGIGTAYDKKYGKVGETFRKLALRGRLHQFVTKYQTENKDTK